MFSKLFSRKTTAPKVAAPSRDRFLVLYGSQTGTAETFARTLAMFSRSHGLDVTVREMNAVTADDLANNTKVAFLCSTYGNGEFPSNASGFFDKVVKNQIPVKNVKYAILGLGNSRNELFNKAAKDLDEALTARGATRMSPTTLSCELNPEGHQKAFRPFAHNVWAAMGCIGGPSSKELLVSTYDFVEGTAAKAVQRVVSPGFTDVGVQSNAQLTPDGYEKTARQMVLDTPEALQVKQLGRKYVGTDHVQVMPRNAESAVEDILRRLHLDGDKIVTVKPQAGSGGDALANVTASVRTLLRDVVDLHGAPSRTLLETFSQAATDPKQAEALEKLAEDMSPDNAYTKRVNNIWTIAEALLEYSSVKLSLEQVLTYFPHIQPRTYSIANDPSFAGGAQHIELCYSKDMKKDPISGRVLNGLCSTYLDGLKAGDALTVKLVPGVITAPAVSTNLVLVCMGTGISAIRALLQQRLVAKKAGQKVGHALLFYGFRHEAKDYLFRNELATFEREGLLEIVTSASHDQATFITPVDRIQEKAARVKDMLEPNGTIVYCGIGGSVPRRVDMAFQKAGVNVATLRRNGRFLSEHFTVEMDAENLFTSAYGSADQSLSLAEKFSQSEMFCFQCEQTFQNKGCVKVGVCGKTPRVAALQDLLVHGAKSLSWYATQLRALKAKHPKELTKEETENVAANRFTLEALFTTLTNVNFDAERFVVLINRLNQLTKEVEDQYRAAAAKTKEPFVAADATLVSANVQGIEAMLKAGGEVGVLSRFGPEADPNVAGVCEMLIYGLKGICAYADHSLMNHLEDPRIYEFVHEALAFLIGPDKNDLGKALKLCLRCGEVNAVAMELLYKSNSTLGVPSPATVPVQAKVGKCILVSGHDMILLESLLEKTEKLGINVYTHGEMLPAHSYPKLRKYKTLAGHFGTAWNRQSVEFPHFPGSIIMTTNCLTEPKESYKDNLFTVSAVGWNNVPHLGNNLEDVDWTKAIEAAQKLPGFTSEGAFTYPTILTHKPVTSYTVGFGHEAILGAAPVIIDQIKKGNITRFFVIGGCDGFEGQRSYYTDLAEKLPNTAVILTVGCGKFRINHLPLGTIADTGIPRLLDMGQCNDSWSAVQVAIALAGALNCKVSDLPLSIVLSWFEQKAVAVLLTCLALGLKPIHIGPSLPAFITPAVLDVLVKDFGVRVIGNPEEDAKTMCAATGPS